jgi:hypothetical protein
VAHMKPLSLKTSWAKETQLLSLADSNGIGISGFNESVSGT